MTYRLIVLTHGCYPWLAQTLTSFRQNVQPEPVETIIVADGAVAGDCAQRVRRELAFEASVYTTAASSRGFCYATSFGWNLAAKPGVDWVFWLEHDFLFLRRVNVVDLAKLVLANAHLAQVALMRAPVNEEEREAGGIVAAAPAWYQERTTVLQEECGIRAVKWLEHARNWTTNPSLFPRAVAERHPWPLSQQCEGAFGFQLRERDPAATFAFWGTGEPWVEHVGERTGHSY